MEKNYKIIHITCIILILIGTITAIAIKACMFKACLLSPALDLWTTAVAVAIFLACLSGAILLFLVVALLKMIEEYINIEREE